MRRIPEKRPFSAFNIWLFILGKKKFSRRFSFRYPTFRPPWQKTIPGIHPFERENLPLAGEKRLLGRKELILCFQSAILWKHKGSLNRLSKINLYTNGRNQVWNIAENGRVARK